MKLSSPFEWYKLRKFYHPAGSPKLAQQACLFHGLSHLKVFWQVIFVFLLFWGMVMFANDVETNGKQKLPEIKTLISSLDFFCYLIIKEHDEFGVAFKLYFLHSSTIIGSTCVSVWIQEGWIEWLATLF